MSSGLLTLSKYVVLAVLYLFFLRVLRAVWVELREPKVLPLPTPTPTPAPTRAAASAPAGPTPAPMADPALPIARGWSRRARRQRAGDDPATDALVLQITSPEQRRDQTFELGDELTVGRAAGCGVSLPEDTFISQLHARVFRRDGDLWVEDLGSTNGTLLNDRRVSAPAVMRRGDVLQVGRTVLEVTEPRLAGGR